MSLCIGHAFDVHPFSDDPERNMVLGGVISIMATVVIGRLWRPIRDFRSD